MKSVPSKRARARPVEKSLRSICGSGNANLKMPEETNASTARANKVLVLLFMAISFGDTQHRVSKDRSLFTTNVSSELFVSPAQVSRVRLVV